MADKVYCEECKSLVKTPTACSTTGDDVTQLTCKHKNNIAYTDAWLRRAPKHVKFKKYPNAKNLFNDCSDFEPK